MSEEYGRELVAINNQVIPVDAPEGVTRAIPAETILQREINELAYSLSNRPPRYVESWWLRFLRWLVKKL